MRHFLGHRTRRIPALLFCLALFLGGSNYCLLSAWAGNTHMACMTAPGATSAAPRCHHCAPAGKTSRSGQPAGRSCCPDPVLMPAAPSLDTVAASHALPFTFMLAADLAPSAAPFLSGHSPPLLPAGQPATGPACAPQAPRAPPLA